MKKTVKILTCDKCGKEADEAKGSTLRVTAGGENGGSKVADLCDNCTKEILSGISGARDEKKRGAKPKTNGTPAPEKETAGASK